MAGRPLRNQADRPQGEHPAQGGRDDAGTDGLAEFPGVAPVYLGGDPGGVERLTRGHLGDRPGHGAGVENAFIVRTVDEFDDHCARGLAANVPYVVVAKVAGTVQPDIKRKHSDGREDKYIFVRHVEATENIVIMGPSEHN